MNILRNKSFVVTIVAVVILVFLVVASRDGNILSQYVSVAGEPFVPLQQAITEVSSLADSPTQKTTEDLVTENLELQDELAEYKEAQQNYEDVLAENERLSELLEYKQNNETQELKVAQIIGKDPGNWFDVFTIDLGINDGIEEDMAVITADGLVGRVEEVGLNWAKVMGVIDGRSNVSAIVERTRDIGVVKGEIGGDDLTAALFMNYLPLDTDVVEGDVILTSGYDEIYPKGLTIGTVISTATDAGGKNIVIEPSVDFRRLEEVMVVVGTSEVAEVSQEDIADGSAQVQPLPTPEDEQASDEQADDSADTQ